MAGWSGDELVCRGDWQLGTACGRCERCLRTKPATPGGPAPSFQPVHRLEGWIAPADLYAAINTLADQNPDAKHVCWDMLILANALPRTQPDDRKHKEAGK